MGFIDKTPEGRYRAYYRDPSGKQHSKTFRIKKDATAFVAEVETSKARGSFVSPHFLTKSQRYSTTFRAIRGERRTWRVRHELDELARDTWGDTGDPIDLDTVTVINDWRLVGVGHQNHAERELAMAIAERNRQQRTTRRENRP